MKFEFISEQEQKKFLEHTGTEVVGDILDWVKNNLSLPTRSAANSAGYDFVLPISVSIPAGEQVVIPTFIKAELDPDKVLEIYPRSSYGIKKGLMLANTVGVIDADYYNNEGNEGHILICLKNTSNNDVSLSVGDKFAQGVIKQFFVVEGDEYGKGGTRVGGIGSSGK